MPSKKHVFIYITITSILLAIPAIAMQFSNEVQWTSLDFTAAFVMLVLLFVSIEIVSFYVYKDRTKQFLYTFIICVFLIIWIELAVGIFDKIFCKI
jgi:hypothetical protein